MYLRIRNKKGLIQFSSVGVLNRRADHKYKRIITARIRIHLNISCGKNRKTFCFAVVSSEYNNISVYFDTLHIFYFAFFTI